MFDKNTMGKTEYILTNVFWVMVTMVAYNTMLFVPIEGLTVKISKIIIWAIELTFVSIGLLLTFKKRKNYLNVIVNVIFPLEIYALISYMPYFNIWVCITIVLAIICSLGFFLMVILNKKGDTITNESYRIFKKIKHGALGARTIASVCMLVLIIPLCINYFAGKNLFEVKNETNISSNKWTIANNIETVEKITPEIWDTLSVNEKLEVLKVIKNIEVNYLGINHELYLTAESLEEDILGTYVNNERKIIIDIEHLKNSQSSEVVRTLAHECHHAYTKQLVKFYQTVPEEYKNMLIFADVQKYEEEYDSYKEGTGDYKAYATQFCEKHAEKYAQEAVDAYFEAILKNNTKGE